MNWKEIRRWPVWQWRKPSRPALPPLVETVEQARREWLAAQQAFREATGQDVVDQVIHRLAAAERHYMHLLKEAREQGVTAMPGAAGGEGPGERTACRRLTALKGGM